MISGFRPDSGPDVESRSAHLYFITHNCLFFPFIDCGINWSSAAPMAKARRDFIHLEDGRHFKHQSSRLNEIIQLLGNKAICLVNLYHKQG